MSGTSTSLVIRVNLNQIIRPAPLGAGLILSKKRDFYTPPTELKKAVGYAMLEPNQEAGGDGIGGDAQIADCRCG